MTLIFGSMICFNRQPACDSVPITRAQILYGENPLASSFYTRSRVPAQPALPQIYTHNFSSLTFLLCCSRFPNWTGQSPLAAAAPGCMPCNFPRGRTENKKAARVAELHHHLPTDPAGGGDGQHIRIDAAAVTAMQINSRLPSDTALKKAVRSAQMVGV